MNIKGKMNEISWRSVAVGFLLAVGLFLGIVIGVVHELKIDGTKLAQVARFLMTMQFVESQYVNEVDSKTLIDGAIGGMVRSLDDPYSVYLPPDMLKRLQAQTSGEFGGIGVVMRFDNSRVFVQSVMDGTPGEAAGLMAGDEILAVDGVLTSDMEPEHVAMSIRGEKGTDVVLTIGREGEKDTDYTLTRDMIHYDTAAGTMIGNPDEGIGYIRVSSFSENTAKEFETSYNDLKEKGLNGLIIDLRGNPGGFVTTCVDIANLVVPKGTIVSVVQRDGTKEVYESKLEESTCPIVVLIDEGSASASEILAGALQDTGVATIVGRTSFGKGSVQVVMPIPGEADAVKLTIAKYYTPNGRSLMGTGITPDVDIEQPKDAVTDVQLEKAVEVMREKISSPAQAE